MTGIGGTSVNIDATELGRLRAAIGRWPRNYLDLVARHAALEQHAALLADDVARLTAKVARVEALHRPIPSAAPPPWPCAACADWEHYDGRDDWPCATIRALADDEPIPYVPTGRQQ